MREASGRYLGTAVLVVVASCGRYNFERRASGGGDDAVVDGDGDGNVGTDTPLPPGNVAFVTSTKQLPGMLGGLAGADALCTMRANAAGLPGSYVAWLSTTTVNARDRLTGSRGWYRRDGRPIVDTVNDLVARGTMYYPLVLDEYGQPVPGDQVGTATLGPGTFDGVGDCNGYASSFGRVDGNYAGNASGFLWTTGLGFVLGCNDAMRMYCFGVGQSVTVSAPTAVGRRAFVTDATWTPTGGLATADATCQTAATAAGLIGGTFRALLATTTTSAASRIDLGGAPWVRLDGVPIVDNAAQLTTSTLGAALNRTPTTYLLTVESAWVGASSLNAVGSAATTCNDWTSSATTGLVVRAVGYGANAFFGSSSACTTPQRLFCLEQ